MAQEPEFGKWLGVWPYIHHCLCPTVTCAKSWQGRKARTLRVLLEYVIQLGNSVSDEVEIAVDD